MSAVICQGCIWPNKPVFLIAVTSCVDPGSGFRNIKDLACLVGEYFKGYALLCGISRCTKFLAFFHHQHGTSVPSSTYSRWGLKVFGPWRWEHHVKDIEYVIDRPGDSGLGRAKNTS